jgi:hypothetical protein
MSLQDWVNDHSILPHKTSSKEIKELLDVVDRELDDSNSVKSADGRFFHAYQASFILCSMVLYALGYKASRVNNHITTIMVMPEILGDAKKKDADYIDSSRAKRNLGEYTRAGGVTSNEADELLEFAVEFREEIIEWFKKNHPDLLNI